MIIYQAFDFFQEEIEISIESTKMELDNADLKIRRKLKKLRRSLLKINIAFKELLN